LPLALAGLVAVATPAAVSAGAAMGAKAGVAGFAHYEPAKRYTAQVTRSFYLPMRDGTRIAVRVTQPAVDGKVAPGRFPVIWQGALTVTQAPAPGNGPDAGGYAALAGLTDYGYVVVQIARRGNGQSFGVRRGYHERNEAYDAYEVTEWLAAQPWSDGKVGIYGCSNTGDAAMHAITVRPPHLKAVWAGCFSWSKYDAMRRGGLLAQWGTGPQRTLAEDSAIEPVDGDAERQLLRAAATEHLQSTVLLDLWKGMPYRDSLSPLVGSRFWGESSVSSYADAMRHSGVALYIQGAWQDEFRDQGLTTFLNYPGARVLIGPWRHCQSPGFALVQEIHRFFDQELKGLHTGLEREAPIHYYTVGAPAGDEWRTARQWPVPGARARRLYLADGHSLLPAAPSQAVPQRFTVHAPLACPQPGTNVATEQPCHLAGEGQSFTGAPLGRDTEVTGDGVVELRLSVDRTDADLFAYLEDVAPDGGIAIVTEGRLRASFRREDVAPWRLQGIPWHRAEAGDAQPLRPGEAVTLRFALLPASHVFRAGHRIQLTVTGADYRQRDLAADAQGAQITLNPDASSHVELPVVGEGG
jgi:hypothetical protein